MAGQNPVQIARDPFARETTYRKIAYPFDVLAHGGCAWCGGFRPTTRASLFRYGVERDGLWTRIEWDSKLFCSKECRDSYWW